MATASIKLYNSSDGEISEFTEAQIVAGGCYVEITLVGDTWIAAAAGSTERIYPDADITTNWGGWSEPPHWDRMDEAYGTETEADGGIVGTPGDTEEIRFANVAVMGAGNTCTKLEFYCWLKLDDGTSESVDVKYSLDNGSSWETATQTLTVTSTSYQYYIATFSSLSLTQSQVNGLAIQMVTADPGNGNNIVCSALSCVVTYT